MSEEFFTADLHCGHGNIIKYCGRPFLSEQDRQVRESVGDQWSKSKHRLSWDSIRMMNDAIFDGINATVGEDDTLRIIGDFAFGQRGRYFEQCRAYRERIKCKNVYLVWGNHDRAEIAPLFSECHETMTLRICEYDFVLRHAMDAIDLSNSNQGTIKLYGHTHGTVEEVLDMAIPNRLSMDVGVDNAYKILGEFRPFSATEILNRLIRKDADCGRVVH